MRDPDRDGGRAIHDADRPRSRAGTGRRRRRGRGGGAPPGVPRPPRRSGGSLNRAGDGVRGGAAAGRRARARRPRPARARVERLRQRQRDFAAADDGRPDGRLLIPEGFAIRDIVQRAATIGIPRRAYRAAIKAAHPPAGYRATGKRAPRHGGLPVPRDLRARATSLREDPRGGAAAGVHARDEPRRLPLRGEARTDALRRADHRLDDRARGRRTGRSPEDRSRHLQPPARRHAPRHRRDRAVRGRLVAARDGTRPREREPLQHPQASRACRRRRSRTRDSPRSRRPRIRRRCRTSTTSRSPATRSGGTSSPRASTRSTRTSRSTASGDPRRRPGSRACSATRSSTRARRRCRTRRSASWGSTPHTWRSACSSSRLAAAVHGLAALGVSGANVTIPHKEAAALALRQPVGRGGRRRRREHAALQDGRIDGHLTDGLGMLDALRDEGVDPAGRPALMRGRGRIGARCGSGVCSPPGRRPVRLLARRAEAARCAGARRSRRSGTVEIVVGTARGPARDRRALHAGRRADRA